MHACIKKGYQDYHPSPYFCFSNSVFVRKGESDHGQKLNFCHKVFILSSEKSFLVEAAPFLLRVVSCAQEKTREGKGAHKNQLLSLRSLPMLFVSPLTGLLGTFP